MIQKLVCQRLTQFTHRKTLWLGRACRLFSSHMVEMGMVLELTLEARLDKLIELKKLQKLDINCNQHRVNDVKEIKLMVKHWPKLQKIHGLGRNTKAYNWIKKNHPKIELE